MNCGAIREGYKIYWYQLNFILPSTYKAISLNEKCLNNRNMGTWGLNNFENDGASDFAADILEGDKSLIKDTIVKVTELSNEEYLEAPDCENALVAIEFIAAFKGKPSEDLPKDAVDWIKKNDLLDFKTGFFGKRIDIINLSITAIDRITSNSELKELWEESDEFEEWKRVINNLKQRII